jgi:colicin import membrane protein
MVVLKMESAEERHELTMAHTLTPEIIRAAIDGYEAQKARIDLKIADLRAMLPGGAPEPAVATATPKRGRKISAAARTRMAEGQRKRWAALRGQPVAVAQEPPRSKRRLSAAGRAAIVAALKKRWAAKKAEAAKAAAPATKKSRRKKTPATKAAPQARQAEAAKRAPAKTKATPATAPAA